MPHLPPADTATPLQDLLASIAAGPDWGVHAVEAILRRGDALNCTDVHIASLRDALVVRCRAQGSLFLMACIADVQRELVISRLKVLARLPTFLKTEPQDGRLEFTGSNGRPRLLRISFLPTIHGENVVIRYPREDSHEELTLDTLGMSDECLADAKTLLRRQEGAILLTGPSSSGKTTTMYAMLKWLNETHGDRMNILTIEDPVERDLGFAGQVQVNPVQDLTFERALRSALRQDPNVLMVGEIRDVETARVTIQAGMSGHLVISTLHAGRASLVFSRLLSMGIEPYLVASAVSGSIAQRLARTICRACAGAGCDECSGTGSRGRIALFECCRVTEDLRELILACASPARVAAAAAASQSATLADEGRRYVESGTVSRGEFEYLFAGEDTI